MSETDFRAQLHQQLRQLRNELQTDIEQVASLRAVRARRDEIDRLVGDFDHQLERLPRAAVVTLVGATGAGKSALLNALVGSRIATEGVDRPTTRQPVVYAPHDADLTDLLAALSDAALPTVVRYDRPAAGPWTTQVLVDAPDLNSVAEQHRDTVSALAERSDVLLVVLHHQSVVEEASVSFIDTFAGRRRLVFVLNRIDELSESARDALLVQVRQLAARRWHAPDAPVVGVSARLAQTQPHSPGWAELCESLHALVRDSAIAGVRRLNALGTASRLEQLFVAVNAEVGGDLAVLPDEAVAGVANLAERAADEVATRLRLRQTDVTGLLLAEAAKRWDGPGGWALRSGTMGLLGVGAGALLARRHPLLATGATTGSLAADQMRQAAQRERLIEMDGLLPNRSEFGSWFAEALSPARLRAARLVGEPEALGLPSADDLRADTAAAVDEAWSTFVERDLPAAAQRSVLRYFRFVLDLPVYVLVAWVVYRVANGFISGNYTGTDFLINALLLAATYLLVVTVIIRRALALRGRALLRHITGHARAAVNELSQAVRRGVSDATSTRLSALARLTSLHATWRDRCGVS